MRKEKNEYKKNSFSWADGLLILLIGLIILIGVRYLLQRQRQAVPNATITYLLRVTVEEELLSEGELFSHLVPEAPVLSQNGTARLGKITDRWTSPVLQPTVREAEATLVEDPFRRYLYVKVTGRGIHREGEGLRIRDIRIAAGAKGDFRLGGYLAENAEILAVWEEDAS